MIPATAETSNEVATLLSKLRTAPATAAGPLSLVPVLTDEPDGPDARLLEEAIAAGEATVAEVGEHGVVGQVRVVNGGAIDILIIDGEQIAGAKQNRIFNASFVVGPGVVEILPVSCVERGRWGYGRSPGASGTRASELTATGFTLSGTGRSRKLGRVVRAARTRGTYDADQEAVWQDVDAYLERTEVRSDTSAFADGFTSRSDQVERILAGIEPMPGQVGIAAVHCGKLVALDVFGSARLYTRAWKKVVRGTLGEVYPKAKPSKARPEMVVRRALNAAMGASFHRQAAPGGGESLHGEHQGFVAGAISKRGVAYHLVLAGLCSGFSA